MNRYDVALEISHILKERRDQTIVIVGKTQTEAREFIETIVSCLTPGVFNITKNNKWQIKFNSGSELLAFHSKSWAIKGRGIRYMFILDSVPKSHVKELLHSIYPIVTSGHSGKFVIENGESYGN